MENSEEIQYLRENIKAARSVAVGKNISGQQYFIEQFLAGNNSGTYAGHSLSPLSEVLGEKTIALASGYTTTISDLVNQLLTDPVAKNSWDVMTELRGGLQLS